MSRSAHAFVRGSTVSFYEWLAEAPKEARPPEGPPVWICGDCHVGNLGPVADARGVVEVQIRDLDQTVIGNPAHDLIRLGLSLASAARGSDLPGVTTAHMMEQLIGGYQLALHAPDADHRVPEPASVKTVKRRALGRRWRELASERIADETPQIPLGKTFWPLRPDERSQLDAMLRDHNVERFALRLAGGEATSVRLVDAAYWVKGCSSLGKLRVAAVIELRGEGRQWALIDIKEAVDSVAPAASGAQMPDDPAERVVAGARALSPSLGKRMLAYRLGDTPVFARELKPQDLKLELEQFTRKQAVVAARYLGFVVGKAHAAQLDEASRAAWKAALQPHSKSDLDAPSWLWRAVLELAARHEAAYLEHCRVYALARAA